MSQPDIKVGSAAMTDGQGYSSPVGMGLGESKGIARVTFVLYDDSDLAKFNEMGGWKALGSIKCISYINNSNSTSEIIARPIDSHYTKWPLVNELVHIQRGVSYKSQGGASNYDSEWYYTDIIPTWNATEHNATPDSNALLKNSLHKSTYQEASNGLASNSNTKSDVSITGVFNQTGKVNKLIKLPGDHSIEGRSGNTIRFGSSIDGFNSPFTGPDRNPLIMMTNGQRDTGNKLPMFEDVNKDGSSFYMLHSHNVRFDATSHNFDSFYTKVKTAVKSNYVETLPATNTPVSQSASSVDNLIKPEDIIPENNPVANATQTDTTVKKEDDLATLPLKESDLPFAQETQDIVKKSECQSSTEAIEPNRPASINPLGFSKYYNVVFSPQPAGKPWCYIACLSMLFDYLGVTKDHSQDTIDKTCTDQSGDIISQLAASNYGLSYLYKSIDNITGYSDIINYFNQYGPIIVERKPYSANYKKHFVVVTGIDSTGKLRVNDPARKDPNTNQNKTLLPEDLKTDGSVRIYKK